MTLARLHFLGALAILALVLVACGGGSSSEQAGGSAPESVAESVAESMAASEGESAAPSDATFNPGGAAAGVSELSSYQLDISLTTAGESTNMTILTTNSPTAATHYTMTGTDTLEIISIQDQGGWVKQGDTWIEPPGGVDLYLSAFSFFAPDRIVSQYRLGFYAASFQDMGSEERNGVTTKHLHLDAADISGASAEGFPEDGMFDLWVADSGGYLVGLAFSGTDAETGEYSEMTMEVSRVNDSSISIEPPI